MNNKKKLNGHNIARSERNRMAIADFDDAITVRERDIVTREDDRDSREDLVWELDSFRWEWN